MKIASKVALLVFINNLASQAVALSPCVRHCSCCKQAISLKFRSLSIKSTSARLSLTASSSEFQNWPLWLVRIHEPELHLSDADDVEGEAIGLECLDRFLVRDELKFLAAHEDFKDAIACDDVGYFLPRRTASLDEAIQKTRAAESNEVALQAPRNPCRSERNSEKPRASKSSTTSFASSFDSYAERNARTKRYLSSSVKPSIRTSRAASWKT
jgi:hypothetical protein